MLKIMSRKTRTWLTRMLFPTGQEPDPRFTLANERTFLAWIRTALAFLAGGVGAYAIADTGLANREDWVLIAFALPVVACCICVTAVIRWVRVERAMRTAQPLPAPAGAPVLVLIVLLVSAFAVHLVMTA